MNNLSLLEAPMPRAAASQMYEWRREEYTISTDPEKIDVVMVHRFLAEESYWAKGRPFEVTQRALDHSVCFGLFRNMDDRQVGFARVVTDFATYGYLMDVFVLRPYRRQGLGKWLVQCVLAHPALQGVSRWQLKTADAHGLYARYGFARLTTPDSMMEL
jgi:GNAT superfamily N-acetyltransferase